ncbi:MAG: hypothetical protein HY553_07345 [Elusimicrobia bacterium]|nr:hypothetical protein [Elusimicrobiota bacterium]
MRRALTPARTALSALAVLFLRCGAAEAAIEFKWLSELSLQKGKGMDVVVSPDDKGVFVGGAKGSPRKFWVARVDPDNGRTKPPGWEYVPSPPPDGYALGVGLAPDGSVLAVGLDFTKGKYRVVSLGPDSGKERWTAFLAGETKDPAIAGQSNFDQTGLRASVAADAQGNVFVGRTINGTPRKVQITRLRPDGTVDASVDIDDTVNAGKVDLYFEDLAVDAKTGRVYAVMNTKTPPQPFCGNRVCETGETCKNCAVDCGACGPTPSPTPSPTPPPPGGCPSYCEEGCVQGTNRCLVTCPTECKRGCVPGTKECKPPPCPNTCQYGCEYGTDQCATCTCASGCWDGGTQCKDPCEGMDCPGGCDSRTGQCKSRCAGTKCEYGCDEDTGSCNPKPDPGPAPCDCPAGYHCDAFGNCVKDSCTCANNYCGMECPGSSGRAQSAATGPKPYIKIVSLRNDLSDLRAVTNPWGPRKCCRHQGVNVTADGLLVAGQTDEIINGVEYAVWFQKRDTSLDPEKHLRTLWTKKHSEDTVKHAHWHDTGLGPDRCKGSIYTTGDIGSNWFGHWTDAGELESTFSNDNGKHGDGIAVDSKGNVYITGEAKLPPEVKDAGIYVMKLAMDCASEAPPKICDNDGLCESQEDCGSCANDCCPVPCKVQPWAFPNPFRPAREPLRIQYELERAAPVSIEIQGPDGRRVRGLSYERDAQGGSKGRNDVSWDGKDERGEPAAPGAYDGDFSVGEPYKDCRRLIRIGVR